MNGVSFARDFEAERVDEEVYAKACRHVEAGGGQPLSGEEGLPEWAVRGHELVEVSVLGERYRRWVCRCGEEFGAESESRRSVG